MRTFVCYFLSLSCLSAVVAEADDGPASRKPNLLWIVGENISLDLGCYGMEHVATPNLDRLAAEGMRYTHVYATAPVCSASRSAFMTGMYQTTIDAHHARSHRDDGYPLPKGVRPITYRLRDVGYYTVNLKTIGEREIGTGKIDLNLDIGPKLWEAESDWSVLKGHEPFFAQINMPEVEFDIYDRQTWKKERVEWVGEAEHPQVAKPDEVTPPPYYPDHEITRQEWARYLNSISGMDVRIGDILRKLEADGLADDTIVIFFADNGRMDPRSIHWCYDTGVHVPMIIRFPRNFPPPEGWQVGGVSDRMISLLDLTATTLDLAGIAKPAGMQSEIFLGPHADPPRAYTVSARDRIDETEQRIRTVQTTSYQYVRNFTPGPIFALNRYKEKCFRIVPLMRAMYEAGSLNDVQARLLEPLPPDELYDLQNDPDEIHNLVESDDGDTQLALGVLRHILQTWMETTGDRGAIPEPAEVVAPFTKEMHDWFGTPEWARKPAP